MSNHEEVLAVLPDWLKLPVFMALAAAAVFTVMSKALAEAGGVFGTLARALQRQKQRAKDAADQSDQLRLERLEAAVARLDAEVSELRSRENDLLDYVKYVTRWNHTLELWAAKSGVDLPPPPLSSYEEWRRATLLEQARPRQPPD